MSEQKKKRLNREDHRGTEDAAALVKGGTILTAAVAFAYKNKDKIMKGLKVAAKVLKR